MSRKPRGLAPRSVTPEGNTDCSLPISSTQVRNILGDISLTESSKIKDASKFFDEDVLKYCLDNNLYT